MEKLFVAILFLGAVCLFCQAAGPFDGVNVDQMLSNPIVVQRQIRCISCKGPCDRLGAELKRVLPSAASSNCLRCTSNERENFRKIVTHVQTYYPREWQEMTAVIRSGRKC